MITLQEIEAAIDQLPQKEVFTLRDWIEKRLDDDWAHSYRIHWARHATNALSAIEIYRTDNFKRV